MTNIKNRKIFFVFLIASLLIVGVAFSGCTEDDENGEEDNGEEDNGVNDNGDDDNGDDDNGDDDNGDDDNGDDDNGDDDYVGTGTETFSGTWE